MYINDLCSIIIVQQLYFMQLCFSFPRPLNVGLSLQYLHVPQSSDMHPVHTPQRFLFDFMFSVEHEAEWHKLFVAFREGMYNVGVAG